jgi:hypothetical protein
MKARARFLSTRLLALLLCVSAAFAQTPPPAPAQPVFTQQELDQMLAPIALYPDSLLSQILMAATYPIEIVQAARWSKANPNITGDQAVRAVEQNSWDPSVKSLVAFPQILAKLDENLDWTERLGDAFLSQQQQVMDTVQELRKKAQAAGNLNSNEYVRVEPQGQTIVVEPANPEVIYVPYYSSTVVYGPWWWPDYPPVYWGPWPGYYARPGFGVGFYWGVGIPVGVGFFFGAFNWPYHYVNVVNVNSFYYRPSPHVAYGPPGSWQHDPGHRRGVPYRDPVLRQQFPRPDARPDARREYRGNEPYRLQGPGTPASRPDAHNVPGGRPQQGYRTQPGAVGNARPNVPEVGRPEPRSVPTRPTAPISPSRPNVEPQPHIFEGVGQGATVRDSSARGHSSYGEMAPVSPAARPQGSAPAAHQGGPASSQRPSGGGRAPGGQPHVQQR